MKLLHSADVQVKNRITNLYKSSLNTLRQIEKHVINEKAEIFIWAGDMFEYATPTQSEQKLIYNHLSRLVNISTLKEIVIIPGNHDLLKEKKESDLSVGNNPINVFIEMIQNLDAKLASKIIYMNESKIYPSKISSGIEYVSYSLEDNMTFAEEPVFDKNKIQICIFHGMLKEYVDSVKLPLRKDIYESLKSIEIFPENSLIPSGDIHLNLKYEGLNGQVFYYPGSPMQHTHNEGSFIRISETIEIQKEAEGKSIKMYDFSKGIDFKNLVVSNLPLQNTIEYITIELDYKPIFDLISMNIKKLFEILVNANPAQTFIKIKSSNVFLKYELAILKIIQDEYKIADLKVPQISFEYDKLVVTGTGPNNKIIQEILVEKEQENLQQENIQENLEHVTIDSLILSDIHLHKLFQSVLDSSLKTIDDADITNQELSTDIRNLFQKELSNLKTNSKRYEIKFNSIETNGFMALTKNRIELDIPGITRILGTNGIGKTTLYNMLRWVTSGDVFPGMAKTSAVKNNLIIFNKKMIEKDIVTVKLNMTVNGLSVFATRTAERKWKNNTTDEQKASLKWKNYISSVDRNFKLDIITAEGVTKSFTGDQAENSISLWFGDSLDNILFMNQSKLENLLLTPSAKLNEMVLNFVGVDYLDKLENNLDSVKTELMTVGKPAKNKDDLQMEITDASIEIKQHNASIEAYRIEQNMIEVLISSIQKNKTKSNQELLNIGNVPLVIENHRRNLYVLKTFLDAFVSKEKTNPIVFTEVQPVLNQEKIDIYYNQVMELEMNILDAKQHIKINEERNTDLIQNELATLYIKETENIENQIDLTIQEKDFYVQILDENYNFVLDYLNDVISKFQSKKEETETIFIESSNKIKTNDETISKNNNAIVSGICDKCQRPFDENFDEHKTALLEENNQLIYENDNLEIIVKEKSTLLQKIKGYITDYNIYRDMCIAHNQKICDIVILNEKCKTFFSKITEASTKILEKEISIKILRQALANWLMTTKIQHGDYSCQKDIVNEELNEIISTHKQRIEASNVYLEKIENFERIVKSNNTEISKMMSNHNTELENYQISLNQNIDLNKRITDENLKVDEYNNSKLIKQSEYDKLLVLITTLELKDLPLYQEKVKSYDEIVLKEYEQLGLLDDLKKSLYQTQLNLQKSEQKETQCLSDYNKYLQYQKNNLIWKIYSKLIKSSFKEIIFEYYRTFLNTTLNTLLVDLPFKLYWNEDSELYHQDFKNGIVSYQPVNQSSGMETCFLALALVYTIHLLNVKNSVSHIFIDEISGTLNEGKELSYEAINYKEMLVLVLNKFVDKSIFIIDHSITSPFFETLTYEVISTGVGSIYTIIK